MLSVEQLVLITLALTVGVIILAAIAERLKISYPIALVLGGSALCFIPGLPQVELAPSLVLTLVLPPLLLSAGWNTSWRDFKRHIRPISLLATGLVVITTVVVAMAGHYLFRLPWTVAFALGAIVSPTDPLAVLSLAERFGLPHPMVTTVEGESMVNDATSLVLFRLTMGAIAAGEFSLATGAWQLVSVSVGGVLVGLVTGVIFTMIEHRLEAPPLEIALTVVLAYAAYMLGEALGVSGVLSCVAAGLYCGRKSSHSFNATSRLDAKSVWSTLVFLLNGLVFMLLGLQLRRVVAGLEGWNISEVIARALLISAVAIVVRFAYVWLTLSFCSGADKTLGIEGPHPRIASTLIATWSGMRGAVALALALALPTSIGDHALEGRNLIVMTTFVLILVTLVGQGLTFPALLRALKVQASPDHITKEEAFARLKAAKFARSRVRELAVTGNVAPQAAEHLLQHYDGRIARLQERADDKPERTRAKPHMQGYRWLQRALVDVERNAVLALRDDGVIGDEALRRIEHDLDLTDARLSKRGAR